MHNVKIAVAVAASSLATLAFVVACGSGPTPVKAEAAAGGHHMCSQWEVKARKGDLDSGDAIKLPEGWKPFAVTNGTLYSRHCVKK